MLDTTRLTEKQREVIRLFQQKGEINNLRDFCKSNELNFNFVKGFISSEILKDFLDIKDISSLTFSMSSKGRKTGENIPGYLLAKRLSEESPLSVDQLQRELGNSSYGSDFGILKKENAVKIEEEKDKNKIKIQNTSVIDKFIQRQNLFSKILSDGYDESDNGEALEWLVRQKILEEKSVDNYSIKISDKLQSIVVKEVATALTSDLLISGRWKEVEFKRYDIDDEVPDVPYGTSSILTQCIKKIRTIFLEMGFDEMSGQIVDSSFWNFDILFTAQDHPAREIQDTFYLSKPAFLPLPENAEMVQSVKRVHEESYGSQWTEEEASRAVLRTHTTASTARNLYKLNGKDIKYFSIDKVFRNESVDKTHLPEFHQIEGVVVAPDLSIRDLIGYLTDFYTRLGFSTFKFKPTYNPYTEPSLEVLAYYPPSNTFIEVANSGIFRPEVLNPIGYKGKSTIAWGLGLERIAMLLYETEKLADLVGPGISLFPPQSY